jgi:hypothetical protein
MDITNDAQSESKKTPQATSGVLPDGARWERVPRWTVTTSVLADYLSIVSRAAEAAINKRASDPVEEAARALAVGFGAAMITHGRKLHEEGYEQGDFECKMYLGLPLDDEPDTLSSGPRNT